MGLSLCKNEWPNGAKSHAIRRVRKRAQANFAGAWGVPNKQKRAHFWCAKRGTEYPKGYSVPLLADAVGKLL